MIKKKGLRMLFIQLPLINHGYDYIYGNIEYAPGALAGFARHITGGTASVNVLPRELSLFASDRMIVSYVADLKPDIVSFTLYSWNAERSLHLARSIKERIPGCRIFCGGPEIAQGSSSIDEHNPAVDSFVMGEGEWFFQNYFLEKDLSVYRTALNKNSIITQPDNELIPLHETFEPLTGAMLSPMPDGSTCIEMTRGCPYRCAYCYYSKNCPGIRERDFSYLHKALTMVGISELYILSPAFDRSRDFNGPAADQVAVRE